MGHFYNNATFNYNCAVYIFNAVSLEKSGEIPQNCRLIKTDNYKCCGQKPVKRMKKVRENAKLPTRATEGSAGLDLYACIEEPITLNKGDKALIPTGIALGLDDPHYAAFIHSRSGLAIKHGLALLNSVGVVDSDYRGEVCVGIIKLTEEPYTIQPFERIAQMVIKPVELPEIVEVEELDGTDRGAGGFGSTGKK